jgi:hypothetical protein
MPQTQHTAKEEGKGNGASGANEPHPPAGWAPMSMIRIPRALKWRLRAIAASRETTLDRLATSVLQDFATREKGAAA